MNLLLLALAVSSPSVLSYNATRREQHASSHAVGRLSEYMLQHHPHPPRPRPPAHPPAHRNGSRLRWERRSWANISSVSTAPESALTQSPASVSAGEWSGSASTIAAVVLVLLALGAAWRLQSAFAATARDVGDGRVMGQGPFGARYYLLAALAGGICCSLTHGALTPVDVLKTRIQLDPATYSQGFIGGFHQIIANEGAAALLTGLGATAQGYFIQGWFKFGGVEYFKVRRPRRNRIGRRSRRSRQGCDARRPQPSRPRPCHLALTRA